MCLRALYAVQTSRRVKLIITQRLMSDELRVQGGAGHAARLALHA